MVDYDSGIKTSRQRYLQNKAIYGLLRAGLGLGGLSYVEESKGIYQTTFYYDPNTSDVHTPEEYQERLVSKLTLLGARVEVIDTPSRLGDYNPAIFIASIRVVYWYTDYTVNYIKTVLQGCFTKGNYHAKP